MLVPKCLRVSLCGGFKHVYSAPFKKILNSSPLNVSST